MANHHWLDVVVYVMYGGRRARLGQVVAAGDARFVLSSRVLGTSGPIRLSADPIGAAGGHSTRPFTVRAGQTVLWTLERDLSTSSISVR